MSGNEPKPAGAAILGQGASGLRVLQEGMWRTLVRRIGKRIAPGQDAEDLLHSAYIRLHEQRERTHVENEAGFLVKTAVNISIDEWRRRKLLGDSHDDDAVQAVADPAPRQDEVFAHRVRLEQVRECLAALSPRTREVFLMHRVDGLKYREIATQLGISQSAVEKHIAKAVLSLMNGTEDL
jgi:RNA polymerase sigma factor (sigma-70 family)